MNCTQCRERLQEYLDGTLEADEQAQMNAHVASCPDCRRELDELRKVAALVGALDEVPEPAGFLQAVRERIDRPTAWERITSVLKQPLRPGVSVAIPVIIVAFVAVFIIMTQLPKTADQDKRAEEDRAAERIKIARHVEPLTTPTEIRSREGTYSDRPETKRDHLSEATDEMEEMEEKEAPEEAANGYLGGPTRERKPKKGWTEEPETLGRAGEEGPGDVSGGRSARATGRLYSGERGADRAEVIGAERRSPTDADDEAAVDDGALTEETDAAATRSGTAVGGWPRVEKDTALDDLTETTAKAEAEPTDDVGKERADAKGKEEQPTESLFLTTEVSDASELEEGDAVFQFVVLDLSNDLENIELIAKEEGGYALQVREDDVLKLLSVYVPADNFDKAVVRLRRRNTENIQTLQREESKRSTEKKADEPELSLGASMNDKLLKKLTLIVRRITQETPAEAE